MNLYEQNNEFQRVELFNNEIYFDKKTKDWIAPGMVIPSTSKRFVKLSALGPVDKEGNIIYDFDIFEIEEKGRGITYMFVEDMEQVITSLDKWTLEKPTFHTFCFGHQMKEIKDNRLWFPRLQRVGNLLDKENHHLWEQFGITKQMEYTEE